MEKIFGLTQKKNDEFLKITNLSDERLRHAEKVHIL